MPTSTFVPAVLTSEARTVGRPRVFSCNWWDGTTNLGAALTHLGDQEGDATLTVNDTVNDLKLPELTGDAPISGRLVGSAPEVSIPLFLANPALRAKLTPIGGTGGAGHSRSQPLKFLTLAILPEQLFETATGTLGNLVYNSVGSTWTVGGVAATAEQLRLLDLSVWVWKAVAMRPPISFKHADGTGKAFDSVSFRLYQDFTKPEGQQLFTRGRPEDVGINIAPV